jgi:hypothetical protein
METASRVGFALLSREASFFALPGKGLKAASPAPLRATSPDPSRGAVRRRRVCAAQPVTHPVDRLPFLEETPPPVVSPACPADRPPAGAHPFDEFEAVNACLVEYLVIRHRPMVRLRAMPTARPVAPRPPITYPHGVEDELLPLGVSVRKRRNPDRSRGLARAHGRG